MLHQQRNITDEDSIIVGIHMNYYIGARNSIVYSTCLRRFRIRRWLRMRIIIVIIDNMIIVFLLV